MPPRLRPHVAPLGLLLLATLIFFWPVVLGAVAPRGERWHIPQGGGDLVSFLWPTYRYAARALRGGELPLWNPYLYSGAPYIADNQSGFFYPPNMLLALLPDVPYSVMEWLLVLHVLLAGVGMYALVTCDLKPRDQTGTQSVGWGGALVAALAYQFSSVFVTHVGNLNIVAVSAWLPWTVLAMRRMTATLQARWAVGTGVVFAMAILPGHAQMSLAVGVVAAITAAWDVATSRRWLRQLALGALAIALAAGLTAAAVLPAVEMTRYSARGDFSYESAARYSLPPPGLGGMLSPLLFGRGARLFWPAWDRVELGYAGVVALFLAGLAGGTRRGSRRWWAVTVALVGLGIALGRYTPLHRLLFDYVPGFGQLRVPARFVLLTDFALAYLAGLGWADWRGGAVPVRRVAAWGGLLALAVLGGLPLAWRAARSLSGGAAPATLVPAMAVALLTLALSVVLGWRRCWPGLPALLAVELIGLGAWIEVDRSDPDAGYRSGPALEFLQTQAQPFRVDVAATAWQPDLPAVQGLESVGGVSNPLALVHYDAYYWSVGYRGSPQYNFLNVQYLVADKGRPAADATFVPVFDADPRVDVYLNTNAQPRVHLIYEAVILADDQAAFEAVHAAEFDPARQVVLEGGEALPAAAEGERNLYYTGYAAQRQTVVVVTPSPAYVVFGEVWYPGWTASVDGEPTAVLRANYAFRAVRVPAGEHTVELRFQPASWRIGSLVTLGTLAALLLAGVVHSFPDGLSWTRVFTH